MNCLRPFQHWDRGFESHLGHGCLCAFILFVLLCMQVAALRWADPPSKESYRLCKKIKKLKSGQGPTKGCRATDGSISFVSDGECIIDKHAESVALLFLSTETQGYNTDYDIITGMFLSFLKYLQESTLVSSYILTNNYHHSYSLWHFYNSKHNPCLQFLREFKERNELGSKGTHSSVCSEGRSALRGHRDSRSVSCSHSESTATSGVYVCDWVTEDVENVPIGSYSL
jgi:hypothetical protein